MHVEFATGPSADLLALPADAGSCLAPADAAYVDAAAMAAWRSHSDFHVLK